jgi:7-cyano-7-deazaguanine synthase
MTSKALVILSGGQDSTTCLFWAKQRFSEVFAITFDYNQRHVIELDAARKVAEMAGVQHEIVKVPNCLISATCPLISDAELREFDMDVKLEGVPSEKRESTFVPMRNALFLTIAANRAEALGITEIVMGVCQADDTNYDDCRQVFVDSAQQYINTALGHDHRDTPAITIHAPLMHRSKAETVELAYQTPGAWEAMAYTHTSYDGKYPPTGHNHANVMRAQGFETAGKPDPLVLRAWEEGLMDLPETANYDKFRSEDKK